MLSRSSAAHLESGKPARSFDFDENDAEQQTVLHEMGYCAQISDLISALIIYLCGFVLFMKNVMSSIAARREEKAIAKAKALAEAKKGGEAE